MTDGTQQYKEFLNRKKSFISEIRDKEYDLIFTVWELMKLHCTNRFNEELGNYCTSFRLIIPTGDFDMGDYGAGILCLRAYIDNIGPDELPRLRLCISTVDDGIWEAWGPYESLANCVSRLRKLRHIITDEIYSKLPTQEEFNKLLSTVNMRGEFVG